MVRVSTALCWNLYFFIRSRSFLSVTGASAALRHFSVYSKPTELQCMQEHYLDMCKRCEVRAVELTQVDPNAVFVNNEVKLSNLQIFGFDFDHTLATYTKSLDEFIFNEARDWMVKQLKYPDDLMNFTYSPDFAIRGLHYDVKKGYLMKVDAYHHIQLDTVYRGFTPVSCEETLEVYNGSHLPSDILKQNTLTSSALAMRSSSKHPLMFQLMDFFTIPEFYLLSSIIELFERQKIKYQPINVYQDVSSSVSRVHKSGLLGLNIMANPERHIYRDPHLAAFLNKLVTDGRKLFLISNSSAAFIDRGMRFLIGEDWRELFDVIISRANKPLFFQQSANQFRHMDDRGHFKDWEGVRSLSRGHIYDGGCLEQLISLTHWNAQHILYFGDHVYSDLAICMISGARWLRWLEREFTYRKVRVSNPTSDSRLLLPRLGQPSSIPALVLPSGGMAARHRRGVTAERYDVSNLQGWTTAAVIPELEHEIMVNNTLEFRRCSTKLRHLEELINSYQHACSPEARTLLRSWLLERNDLRVSSKISFNKYFGSIFRSFHNPSYFSRRLAQYAVLYTSKVSNLYRYPLDHIFYPKRTGLPHEPACMHVPPKREPCSVHGCWNEMISESVRRYRLTNTLAASFVRSTIPLISVVAWPSMPCFILQRSPIYTDTRWIISSIRSVPVCPTNPHGGNSYLAPHISIYVLLVPQNIPPLL
ncbi:hypothetical protein T265_15055 [Opisthorchis viverrini]|uniref:HAD superfamily hydrolase, 5'-nucleotidase n=1 Tax=Opisthorchis viverrini TaxID=6198 RepID=A0A075A2G4_OPIVI|nr:hypothetical protein T265_15055 [Opisthorchis viverrini]KER21579.1 hypothetical protein T265_15055 [Opisthorchis viverrini]